MTDRTTTELIAFGACAAMLIGSLAPWASTFIVDVAGTEGDGKITIACALVALFGLVMRAHLFAAFVGGAGVAVAGYSFIQISSEESEVFGQSVQVVSPAWGLWLTIVAGAVLAVAGYMAEKDLGW